MTLASAVAMVSCDKDDDAVQVPAQVETAFYAMYPNATDVRWSGRSGYVVADFRESGVANSAWFDRSGGWHMTDTDIPYQALPEAVKSSFEASEYATWRIEEVEKVTRAQIETLYVIEVEQREAEMELVYSEDGVLLNAVADDGDNYNDDLLPQQLPAEVTAFIEQRYPGARILEAERERGVLEVDIIDGRTAREEDTALVEAFFRALGCSTFRATADEHDRAMARVQNMNFITNLAYFALLAGQEDLLPYITPSFRRRLHAAEKMLTEDGTMFTGLFEANPYSHEAVRQYRKMLNVAAAGDIELLCRRAQWWWKK